jgi:hypothetical protein
VVARRRQRYEDDLPIPARERVGPERQALDGEVDDGVVPGHGGIVAATRVGCKAGTSGRS